MFNIMFLTVAIPMRPASQIRNVVIMIATRVPNIAYRLIVPKCLKKGY